MLPELSFSTAAAAGPSGRDRARWVAHVDMDAFYASCERLRYPELSGLPVVIGGGRDKAPVYKDGAWQFARLSEYKGRGVVTTATYEARAFGVKSAMPMMKAARLAPDAVLLPVDFDHYKRLSRVFKTTLLALAPCMEDRGIDEVYLELTDLPGVQADGGWAFAVQLQQAVRDSTGLSCSIGLSPNKLLSKIASDLKKPGGITQIRPEDIQARIWPLSVSVVNGIGPKAVQRLAAMGIQTLAQLASVPLDDLILKFGKSYGVWLHDSAYGRDHRPVVTHSEPKSISRETTFSEDLHPVHDKDRLGALFSSLCEKLSSDLQRKGYEGRTVGIRLRYDNFETITRDLTLLEPIHTAADLRRAAGHCLKRVPLDRRLRLLGVRMGKLNKVGEFVRAAAPAKVQDGVSEPLQPSLFDL